MIEGESGDPYEGARIVRQAANAAEASRHERAAADAWSYLAFVTAQRLGDLERAREYADQADAAIERLAGDPERAARVAHYRGLIALRAGDPEGGRGWFERAIALHREAGHEPHVVVLEGLALALGEAGRHTEAIEQFTRVLALRREQFGPDHPDLVDTHTNLAAELVDLGREEEALAHMQAAVDLHAAAYGPDHHEVGLLYYDLGEVLRTLGRPDEGLAHNSRALAIARRVHGDEHSDVALVREYRAGLLLDLGRHDEAIALLREVLASYRRTGGDNGALVAHCRLSLADALRRAGRPDEALAHAREGLAQLEPLLPASSALRGYARTAVARVLIAAGHASEALPALEESLASYPADDTNPYQRALTQATLAQALSATHGDRVRARELARTARDTLARGGAGWASEHDTIDRWLAALPPESPSPRSIAAPK